MHWLSNHKCWTISLLSALHVPTSINASIAGQRLIVETHIMISDCKAAQNFSISSSVLK